jgi:UDP-N-acetylmuramyl pentapeptide synthase
MTAPLWTAAEIAAATAGSASADFTASSVAFDSREVGANDLFIALTGESTRTFASPTPLPRSMISVVRPARG